MKKQAKKIPHKSNPNAYIEGGGVTKEQIITDTLKENFMPYAMSVIISRALPEIDGFKPAHRKLLYTMYQMGLLDGTKTKSANIVGQTMHLNPHGDGAIYETMVRLSRGNEALLHPFVDSKGNFGKAYSRDMAYAASRYTEAKLDDICYELFSDIEDDTVDFVPNYDNSTTEPTLLPVRFPTILVNSNIGIAVSMASNICPFNLKEVCETTIALMKDPSVDVSTTLSAPDFPGGGIILYDKDAMNSIYNTGRGSIKIRSKYGYDANVNCIEITEIPPTTTVEAIIDKIVENVKLGKIKEITDVRDETDLQGLKITIDLKRNIDPDKLMQKLYATTPLQDSFSCNFNVLINGNPNVMGVPDILNQWILFRSGAVKRKVAFDLKKLTAKLHLLEGLQKILLDIDKAIKIVRQTTAESDVVPNLMIGFGIDDVQANYVAEIKLRNLNKEYILKRTAEVDNMRLEIGELQSTLDSPTKLKAIIIKQLTEIANRYGKERKTAISYEKEVAFEAEVEAAYAVTVFLSKEGYFKKITPQSLRMSGEYKLKENDSVAVSIETTTAAELLFFTDKGTVYKATVSDFADTKASLLGDYIPAKLEFATDEKLQFMVATTDFKEKLLFFFENGKCAKVPVSLYETKTKRKKLANASSTVSKTIALLQIADDVDILLKTTSGKALIFNSSLVLQKSTKNSLGVNVMKLAKNAVLESAEMYSEGSLKDEKKYMVKNIPAVGATLKEPFEQLLM